MLDADINELAIAGDKDEASSILISFPKLQSLHLELVPQIATVSAGSPIPQCLVAHLVGS